MAENQQHMLSVGQKCVPLRVTRNRRAKRMYLRYIPTEHGFSLTLPQRARFDDGVAFVNAKSDWIASTLARMPARKRLRFGAILPVLGRQVQILRDPELKRAYLLKGDELRIRPDADKSSGEQIELVLKKIVRKELQRLAEEKSAEIGRSVNRITLRDTRSRWGSCSTTRNLMFSWRLVFAPREVLDYVASHEVAHLRHMNHSAAFWARVEDICPDYLNWKDWLRDHGNELYRFVK
jgi:predicted metal-dependent hydrolase